MDISKVRELVKLVEESGIEELEVSHLDTTIRIQKSAGQVFGAPAMMPQAMAAAPVPAHGPKWRVAHAPSRSSATSP